MWTKAGYVIAEALLDKAAWEESKRQKVEEPKGRDKGERVSSEPPAKPKGEVSQPVAQVGSVAGRPSREGNSLQGQAVPPAGKADDAWQERERVAAEQGEPGAQYALGFRYEHGTGVQKDAATAVQWYLKAAEQGNGAAKAGLLRLGHTQVTGERSTAAEAGQADFSSLSEAIAKLQPGGPAARSTQGGAAPAASFPSAEESVASSQAILFWQRQVQGKMYDNWSIPSGLPNEGSLEVTVLVDVGPDGALRHPRVGKTSGNTIFDHSVIRAIQKTAVVEPAPAGCPACRELEISFRPVRRPPTVP
ncbi:MAG: TonB family protein [Magnetococcus sp. DMHC-8]